MAAFSDLAVRSLASHIEANLDAELRAVETDDGLGARTLGTYSKIVRAFNGESFGGNAGCPEIQVYETIEGTEDQRHDLVVVECVVAFMFTAGNTDPEEAEDFARRWKTALRRVIHNRHPQTTSGSVFFLAGDFGRLTLPYESATRYAYELEVEVRVQSPRA